MEDRRSQPADKGTRESTKGHVAENNTLKVGMKVQCNPDGDGPRWPSCPHQSSVLQILWIPRSERLSCRRFIQPSGDRLFLGSALRSTVLSSLLVRCCLNLFREIRLLGIYYPAPDRRLFTRAIPATPNAIINWWKTLLTDLMLLQIHRSVISNSQNTPSCLPMMWNVVPIGHLSQ